MKKAPSKKLAMKTINSLHRKPRKTSPIEIVLIVVLSICFATFAVLNYPWKLGIPTFISKYSQQDEVIAAVSPAELVDRAMALPRAIVISPHRDLVEMGIVKLVDGEQGDIGFYTCGPAIGVPTKNRWCIWDLGMGCGMKIRNGQKHDYLMNESLLLGSEVTVASHKGKFNANYTMIGSAVSYHTAYDAFTKCVAEGNVPTVKSAGSLKKLPDHMTMHMDPETRDETPVAKITVMKNSHSASKRECFQDNCRPEDAND